MVGRTEGFGQTCSRVALITKRFACDYMSRIISINHLSTSYCHKPIVATPLVAHSEKCEIGSESGREEMQQYRVQMNDCAPNNTLTNIVNHV